MNNFCTNVIDLSSDSDTDINLEEPIGGVDQHSDPPKEGQNDGGNPMRFQDDDWLKSTTVSSSSRPAETSNDQYRNLPPSFTNGGYTRYTYGSADRIQPDSSSYMGARHDSARGVPASKRVGSIGEKHKSSATDEDKTDKRVLPSYLSKNGRIPPDSSQYMGARHDSARGVPASNRVGSIGEKHKSSATDEDETNKRVLPSYLSKNGNTAKSMYPNVASETHKLPPFFPHRNSQSLDENRMTTNIANENLHPSSSGMASQNLCASNTEKEGDDVIVYGGSGSHRVLPSSFGANNPNNKVVNGTDGQGRMNPENRFMDSDERAVYQEALQNISREKREDDLPKGVLTVPLLKHQKMALAWMVSKENSSHCAGGILADDQGLGKTVSTIALIQKQMTEQSKFMSVDSDHLKSEALNLDDDDDEVEQTVNTEPKKDVGASPSTTASGTCDVEPCNDQQNNVSDNIMESKIEHKKKAKAYTSASTMRSVTRPAAGTLVVCPASVMKQWANELADKVGESNKLSVLVYHGGSRTKDPSELAKYDVVVTTYTIVTNEVPKHNADDDPDQKNGGETSGNKRKQPSNAQNKGKKKKKKKLKASEIDLDSGPLARVRWFRVVLDEAQTIKNFRTQVAKACCGLRAKRRWCLSGTPIQNAIDELYSYFCFLKYDPYSTYSSFCTMIKHPIARNAVHGYKKLQTVLKLVLLRRTKETLINGEPIINLPPKTINLEKVDFSQEERSFYLMLEERSRQQFKRNPSPGAAPEWLGASLGRCLA